MKIEIGNGIFENKSKKYLAPCLKHYGQVFVDRINGVYKVAIGIGDLVLSKIGTTYEQHIFILLDTTNNISTNPEAGRRIFENFLSWIREHDSYEDDYPFDNLLSGKLHMVVIKLPKDCYNKLFKFRKSQFSKMYTHEEIEEFFSNSPEVQKVLKKDQNYKQDFVDKINEEYNATLQTYDWEGELDFPIDKKEEVFSS